MYAACLILIAVCGLLCAAATYLALLHYRRGRHVLCAVCGATALLQTYAIILNVHSLWMLP